MPLNLPEDVLRTREHRGLVQFGLHAQRPKAAVPCGTVAGERAELAVARQSDGSFVATFAASCSLTSAPHASSGLASGFMLAATTSSTPSPRVFGSVRSHTTAPER